MLDFVDPERAGRRSEYLRLQARFDETGGQGHDRSIGQRLQPHYTPRGDPLRVLKSTLMGSTFANKTAMRERSKMGEYAVAQDILRRLGLEERRVPSALEDFIDRHIGKDRQPTLRLALT